MATSPSPTFPAAAAAATAPLPDVQNARIPLKDLPGMLHGARWEGISRTSTESTKKAQRRRKQRPKPQTRPKAKGPSNLHGAPDLLHCGTNPDSILCHVDNPMTFNEAHVVHSPVDGAVEMPSVLERLAIHDTPQFFPPNASSGCSGAAGQSYLNQETLVSGLDFHKGHHRTCSTPSESSTTTTNLGPDMPPPLDDFPVGNYRPADCSDSPQVLDYPNMNPYVLQDLSTCPMTYPLEGGLTNGIYHPDISSCGNVVNGGTTASTSGSEGIPGHGFDHAFMTQMDSSSFDSRTEFDCPRGPASGPAYVGVGRENNSLSPQFVGGLFSPGSLTHNILPLNVEGPVHGLGVPFPDDALMPNPTPMWNNDRRGQEPVVEHAFNLFYCTCPDTRFYDPNCSLHGM